MIVPTGSGLVATSTSGPTGTASAGAASAVGAPAPETIDLTAKAETPAITSAPANRLTFLPSMTSSASQTGRTDHVPVNAPHWLRYRWQ